LCSMSRTSSIPSLALWQFAPFVRLTMLMRRWLKCSQKLLALHTRIRHIVAVAMRHNACPRGMEATFQNTDRCCRECKYTHRESDDAVPAFKPFPFATAPLTHLGCGSFPSPVIPATSLAELHHGLQRSIVREKMILRQKNRNGHSHAAIEVFKRALQSPTSASRNRRRASQRNTPVCTTTTIQQ